MSEVVLSLGPIIFRDFEVPSSITFGGRQRAVVRYLGSGRRVTDALGPDDATISFAGILSGPDATARAQELDTLRSLGLPLTLAWNTLIYSVLILRFQAEYRNHLWIPYRISCLVLSNPIIDDLAAVLSITSDALASLNLMYDTAPPSVPPIPDIRGVVSSSNAAYSAVSTGVAIASLDTLIPSLRNEQQKREALVSRLALNSPRPIRQAIHDFTLAVSAIADLQYLTLSQDCLGQARMYLTQQAHP
jgi:hypothetical protein